MHNTDMKQNVTKPVVSQQKDTDNGTQVTVKQNVLTNLSHDDMQQQVDNTLC